ncbi:MAG: NAD-dependent epimerase/dehydratase family protein [Oscillospiraceae bacterium]|nr:NAD-dependent epimerase/dehydratase family protein [Oscillospiraceae bacterium]
MDMNILVTGANGFVGRNLVENLLNIKNLKNRTRPNLKIDEIYCYDIGNTSEELDEFCKNADFVFNLAGVNRPDDTSEFMRGNVGFLETLLDSLRRNNSSAPIMLSSSAQASLVGRYAGSVYGQSKLAGENLLISYGEIKGVKTLVYRFPNLFGKWCRPNYNSAVATFCYNIARDMPVTVNDEKTELELLYIDDLVEEMLDALEGKEHRCRFDGLGVIPDLDGKYCYCPVTHKVTLGEIVNYLNEFAAQPSTLVMPEIPDGSFKKKLYSAFLSYLPEDKIAFDLKMNKDARGSFTELLKTENCGQFSVNVSNPGITKGQHWHNSKWEFFIVVSGKALIEMRQIGDEKVIKFEVSGEKMQAVHMLPGYTHNIINLSKTEPLVTVMWANEKFDPSKPDTFSEDV